MIAMALVCRPALLVADEPTTALDVIVQARTLKLMRDLQSELHMALLLITHDLGVVASLADEVVVVYHGRLMERGAIGELFRDPRHPYLKALMRAVPRMGMDRGERLTPVRNIDVRGEGSPLANRGAGTGRGMGRGWWRGRNRNLGALRRPTSPSSSSSTSASNTRLGAGCGSSGALRASRAPPGARNGAPAGARTRRPEGALRRRPGTGRRPQAGRRTRVPTRPRTRLRGSAGGRWTG